MFLKQNDKNNKQKKTKRMNGNENGSESVRGFFAVLNEEDLKRMKNEKLVNTGRCGVYYKKEELISTLSSRPLPKDQLEKLWSSMHIVEVQTERKHRTNENGEKYMIKGKGIPIINIESFENAKKDLQMA